MLEYRGCEERARGVVLIMARGSKHNIDRAEYMQRRGEYALRGMELPQAKLTDLDVIEIRSMKRQRDALLKHIKENLSNDAIGKKFGIHARTLEKILSHETWSHLP